MTTIELEHAIKEELKSAGLLRYLNEQQEQFLQYPDGFFAEIVVKDGSKLNEVERVVKSVKERLQDKGIQLDEIIRPLWKISGVEALGPAPVPGGYKDALRVRAVLQSGDLTCAVCVDVTGAVVEMLRDQLSQSNKGRPVSNTEQNSALETLVQQFLEFRLSFGGASYWDPRRNSQQELDASAFDSLRGSKNAHQQLRSSIDDIFEAGENERLSLIRSFLTAAGGSARDFTTALSDLPGPGGAFRPGQKLLTSNHELYAALFDYQKEDLKKYYREHLDKVLEQFPSLSREFPNVFADRGFEHGQRKI